MYYNNIFLIFSLFPTHTKSKWNIIIHWIFQDDLTEKKFAFAYFEKQLKKFVKSEWGEGYLNSQETEVRRLFSEFFTANILFWEYLGVVCFRSKNQRFL